VKRDSGLYFALVLSYELQQKKIFPVDPYFAKWTTKKYWYTQFKINISTQLRNNYFSYIW